MGDSMKSNKMKSVLQVSIALQMALGMFTQTFAQQSTSPLTAHNLSRSESLMNMSPSDQLKTLISLKPLLRAGETIVETSELFKIYKENNFQTFWIQDFKTSENLLLAKQILSDTSNKHGLVFSDYWTDDLEAYGSSVNEQNQLAIEVLLTNAFLKIFLTCLLTSKFPSK